jgi:hypothetical protein
MRHPVATSSGVMECRGNAMRGLVATVIPAKGIRRLSCERHWVPACAGTTGVLLLIYGMAPSKEGSQ